MGKSEVAEEEMETVVEGEEMYIEEGAVDLGTGEDVEEVEGEHESLALRLK